jgi:replicative DNA helicase
MDYIQLFPPTKKDVGDWGDKCPRYLQIRHVIDEAILAAEQTKSVIICAAQLGRADRQSGSERNADDTQGWRESGDIEQSAWNLVKMFLEVNENNPAEKQMSYRVAKARSSHHLGEAYILDWTPKYQHMERTVTPKPKMTPWAERAKNEKNTAAREKSKPAPLGENQNMKVYGRA